VLSTNAAVNRNRLGQDQALVHPANPCDAEKAFFNSGHHQANLIHVSRKHNSAPRFLTASALEGNEVAHLVDTQFIRETAKFLPDESAHGSLVSREADSFR
jgi:hypothetical protein